MSHYAIAKIKIKNPNWAALEAALKELAKELGGELVKNGIVYGYGFKKTVNYLVKLKLPYGNGYGIEVTRSGIKVHVDEHGAPLTAEEFTNRLHMTYTAKATQIALQRMHYRVMSVSKAKDRVVIKAVSAY